MERTSMTGRRHAATEREILAAAARLLGSGDAVGMGKIAAAAGIARATLYRYFPTRESLLQALEAGANEEARRGLDEANLDHVPLPILVDSLLVLVAVCVREGRNLGMGSEDMSSTALRLFLAGARGAAEAD